MRSARGAVVMAALLAMGAPIAIPEAADSRSTAAPAVVNSSYPHDLVAHAGYVWFAANVGSSGSLWKSDGTAPHTSVVYSDVYPQAIVWAGNELFFVGYDSNTLENQLEVSDGSSQPTVITSLDSSSEIDGGLCAAGNHVFFMVCKDITYGCELWVSNGTTLGTHLLKDIRPGPESFGPYELTSHGSSLFFTADDGIHGDELWRSDGTTTGTRMVKDIQSGLNCSCPGLLTGYGSDLLFYADDGIHGREPWITDGTPAGTHLLKNIAQGTLSSETNTPFDAYQGRAYFAAQDSAHGAELWRTNGTTTGTRLVVDIWPGAHGSWPGDLVNGSGLMFFGARDATHGFELWRSDGTASRTRLVKDIHSGSASTDLAMYRGYAASLGASGIVFTIFDSGDQLWTSNGTSTGTKRLTPLGTTSLYWVTRVGNRAFFTADDGVHGDELWVTDGTPGGTHVLDLYP